MTELRILRAAALQRFSGTASVNPGLDIYLGSGGRTFNPTPGALLTVRMGRRPFPSRIAAGFVDHDGEKRHRAVRDGVISFHS